MTAEQSHTIYDILNKYFKNEADAKLLTKQIKLVVGSKVDDYKSELASKRDMIELKLDLTEKINRFKTETIVWIVGIGIVQFVLAIFAKKFLSVRL